MGYLKDYQEDCVEAVATYLRRVRELGDARLAFIEDRARGDYAEVDGLVGLPYICLKVPTGGGKTAIAAYCVKPLVEVIGQRESGPVIWLAPTTKIVEQTINALRNRTHPYRRALDSAFDGRITVCDMEAALQLTSSTIETDCVILVTTFGSVRRGDPDRLRAFKVNGALKHHFDGLTVDQREILCKHSEEGKNPTSPTLANVLRMHRPVVIVDEAHNARTALSFETLRRVSPSCILELTATPADNSNVLMTVSAARLKEEEMIKLPVMLRARKLARDAIAAAVEKREELERIAESEKNQHGYVRPIVLYQAETGSREFNVEGVKQILLDELNIDPARVAICIGARDELPDEPIQSEENPVEHIITVQKLREGWDCPFAYILCSVGNLGSRTAVEQILGRILRMPYAKLRGDEKLNRAYCYATSQNFQEAANDLETALVENCGFSKYEARKMVQRDPDASGGGLFGDQPEPVSIPVVGTVNVKELPAGVREHVSITQKRSGSTTITWTGGAMKEEDEKAITKALSNKDDELAIKRLSRRSWSEDDSPAMMGVKFAVPAMAVKEDGQWVLLDDQPLEGEWSLADCNHELEESEFKVAKGDTRFAELDVNKAGTVTTQFLNDLDEHVFLFEKSERDTPAKLSYWLDRAIRDTSVLQHDKQEFILRVIESLISKRGLTIGQLDRHRHLLKDAVAAKIAAHRLHAETNNFQQLLRDDFGVAPECCQHFPASYPADRLCEVTFKWQRHFYGDVAYMNNAELEVAKYIDSLPQILHWARNLEGEHHVNHAFWLRRPHGRFFPDFVAELIGEKFLVIEYKGDQFKGADEQEEKRRVGELWEAQAPDQLAFVWATKSDWQEKIDDAIERLNEEQ